eukprot:1332745-Pyramimonas_sp.AAC.1
MHFGSRHHMRGSNATELEFPTRAIHAGWPVTGLFWHERGLRRLKRELFLGKVVESGIAGLEAFALSPTGYQRIDSCVVKYVRALMRGAATTHEGPRTRSLRNPEVLYRWRILSCRGELA